jgi:hypothetical protein
MNEEIKMRICTRCGEEKPLTKEYFYEEKTAKEGFRAMCKDCTKSKYEKREDFDILLWYNNKSNKFKNEWKFEDIKWIYDNYLNINKKMLKEKFPTKRYKTLTNIIYQWDIRKINQNDDWSDDDIEFLINSYPNISQEELEKRFKDRTWDAIKNKASKLGIERSKEFISNLNRLNNVGRKQPISQRINQSKNRRRNKNHNWKGGLTPLITYFRAILYEWKLDSLKEYNFKCALTDTNNNDLEIHHANENFSDMVYKTFEILKLPVYDNMTYYNEDELKSINKIFLELNYKSGLGIPLKKSIHQLYHTIYGKENNDEEQFKNFVQSYRLDEFNGQLKLMEENNKIKIKHYKTDNGKKYKKLIKEQVIEVKDMISKNMPDRYIANLFKVSELVIYNIRTNRTWKEVG